MEEKLPSNPSEPLRPDSVLSPSLCSRCHVQVLAKDYFCFNCGNNLRPKPLSTSISTQIVYYVGSIVLPPMGVIWGIKYLRERNLKAKIVGLICIPLTVLVLAVAVNLAITLINTVNSQINSQMQNIMLY